MAASALAPAAMAVTKQCSERPCLGTTKKDVLTERRGDGKADEIRGRGGNDVIRANRFDGDRDLLYGGRGSDTLKARDGDGRDVVYGGPRGFDICYADAGDETPGCEVLNPAI
jgi:hypothetical protein